MSQQPIWSDEGTCSSCKAAIVWVRSGGGKAHPCDPAIVTIVTEDHGVVRGRISHFATCPNADKHRRR